LSCPAVSHPTQEPLITALPRAFHWQELIDRGKYSSISDLAEALGLDRSYVSRIMRLTLLAPEIVEAIVDGPEPSGLSSFVTLTGIERPRSHKRSARGTIVGTGHRNSSLEEAPLLR